MTNAIPMIAMMADWLALLAEATVRGSLIIAIGATAAWLLRRRGAAIRSVIWRAVACGVLFAPALGERLPTWGLPVPRLFAETRLAKASERLAAATPSLNAEPVPTGDGASRPAAARSAATPNAHGWRNRMIVLVFCAWLLGALAVTWQLVASLIRIAGLERRARPLHSDSFRRLESFGVDRASLRRVRFLEGPEGAAPMTWGVLRPRVLLPSGWDQWPATVAGAVVAHELAHVRRHDLTWQLPWEVARIVFWFNPLILLSARQAHLAAEQACDDDAIQRGVPATSYADALVSLVRLLRPDGSRVPALVGGGAGELAKRVAAVIDPAQLRRSSRATSLAAAMLVAVASVGTATVSVATRADRDDSVVIDGPIGAALDSALRTLADGGLSGTILVARDDQVVFARGFGFADRERRIAADANTRYHVAGVTKAFTAAAVSDFIDRGLVSPDSQIGRYLPALTGNVARVTVHQLLTHTDGLGEPGTTTAHASAEAFMESLGAAATAIAPGTSYGSMDVGHSLLALLVERVTSRPAGEYLRTRLMTPARMTRSNLRFEQPTHAEPAAVGYTGPGIAVTPGTDSWGTLGSRGLVTTAYDLHRWYVALIGGRLVRQPAVDLMFTPYLRTEKPFEQGYGWLLYDDATAPPFRAGPIPVRRRSGREPGFESEVIHDPNGRWFAAVLLNTDDGRRLDVVRVIRAIMNAHPPPASASR